MRKYNWLLCPWEDKYHGGREEKLQMCLASAVCSLNTAPIPNNTEENQNEKIKKKRK